MRRRQPATTPFLMVWVAGVGVMVKASTTGKLCVTANDGAFTVLPDCVVWVVQVPAVSAFACAPETVPQTAGVSELK